MSLRPDADAQRLASQMLESGELGEILEETVQSARNGRITESGRTYCPSLSESLIGPAARFPRSVKLEECPVRGRTGLMHTHVTAGQLSNPDHSLPDIANVVFHSPDASVVVGTETADVLVRAENEGEMEAAFQEAIGVPVSNTHDVVAAIRQREISDPVAARERVRSAFGPLFRRESAGFPRIARQIQQLQQAGDISAAAPYHQIECLQVEAERVRKTETVVPTETRDRMRALSDDIAAQFPTSRVRDTAVSVAIGTVVSTVLNEFVFDRVR